MKNILFLCFAFLTIGGLHAQPGSQVQNIPGDADQIIRVNLGSIGSKVDWMALMRLAQGHNMGKLHAMDMADFNGILNGGIDFRHDIIIAISNADSIKYTTVIVPLTDSGKFVNMLRTKAKNNFHPYHLAGSKERLATDQEKVFGWNSKIAVLVVSKNPILRVPATSPEAENHLRAARRCVAALHGVSDSKFVTDPRLTAAFSDDADIQLWNRHGTGYGNFENMLKSNPAAAQLGAFTKMFAKASQGPTIGEIRFEPGRIVFSSLKLITPEEKTYLQRLNGQGLSSELTAAIPPHDLLGLVTLHYDLAIAADTIRKMPTIALVESKLKDKGISIDDIINSFKGDFALAVYTPDKTTADTGAGNKKPSLFLLATVNNKASFDKLAPTFKLSNADAAAADPSADTAHHGLFPYYSVKNDLIVLGADRRKVNGYLSQSAGAPNPAGTRLLTDQGGSNMFTIAIDMHAVTAYLTTLMTKGDTISTKDQRVLEALGIMDELVISSGAIQNDAMTSTFELRMTDQNKNGLGSLLEMAADLSKKPDGSPQ